MAGSAGSVGAPVDLSGPTFAVVSGASQGIGRALAVEVARAAGPGSRLLLLARTQPALHATAELCRAAHAARAQPAELAVHCQPLDLAACSTHDMRQALADALGPRQPKDFTTCVIFHNVGSLGNLAERTPRLNRVPEMRAYFDLNVFNVMALNAQFLQLLAGLEERAVVVNVTSLCALKPMAGMAYYCAGKAAREMYFRVLADELPQARVLNYSPGPVETAMIDSILASAANERLRDVFASFRSEQKLLSPEVTARKCLRVLQAGKFSPAEHVDYFDDE